jgi:hypothetical protein
LGEAPARTQPRARGWGLAHAPALGLVALALALAAAAAPPAAPAHPIEDPYLATVVGTPPELRAPAPERFPQRTEEIERFPRRRVPAIFWHGRRLPFSVSAQEGEAPLVFVIAGTGADYGDDNVRFLQAVLYAAGFHVIALTSPTHPDFIVSSSSEETPGYLPADAEDLYAVMQLAFARVAKGMRVSAFDVTGYSLGATQAAFVGALDAREGRFGFQRIYLINPAVDLYRSARILDDLYERSLPEGAVSVDQLVARILRRSVRYVYASGRGPLDGAFVYRALAAERPSEAELQGAIAAVFRLAAANMSFASDVMTGEGRIVEAGRKLGVGTSLTPYLTRSLGWSFERYLDEMLIPSWEDRRPDLDRETLILGSSLESIRGYLERTPGIAVATNADDFVLAPGDLDFLRTTFGERARIHPHGGHCGNLDAAENVREMLDFLGAPAGRTAP